MRPATLAPVSVLAERHDHGTRIRYMGGCRCLPCRASNSRYETYRAALRREGFGNGIVPARRARNHLLRLSRAGVGRRTIADASGVSETVLQGIRSGRRRNCRAETERAVLAVTPNAARPGAYIDAARTWKRIDAILARGGRKAWIAGALGRKRLALQLGRARITKRNADAIDALYRRVVLGREVES